MQPNDPENPMTAQTQIRPCPQHKASGNRRIAYLHRRCPQCMSYLSKHPEAAHLVVMKVPSEHRPSR